MGIRRMTKDYIERLSYKRKIKMVENYFDEYETEMAKKFPLECASSKEEVEDYEDCIEIKGEEF